MARSCVFIPLAILGALVILGLYARLGGRARRVAGDEARSPVDLAHEMERQEAAEEQKRHPPRKAAQN